MIHVVSYGYSVGSGKLPTVVRPQLSVGTAGKVRIYPGGAGFRATTIYRDFDGRNRRIERHAKTKGAAE